MADLLIPIIPPKIREKVFRQHEIFLDDFSDEELRSRYRFGRDSIEFLTEILENHHAATDEEKPCAVAGTTNSCSVGFLFERQLSTTHR